MAVVKLFASLRQISGVKETVVEGASIGEVLRALVQQHSPLADILLESGQVRSHVVITINGHPTLDLQAGVTEQDVIAIFPPLAGG